jgi:hypothetical protein
MLERSNYWHPSVQERLKETSTTAKNELNWKKNSKENVQ